MTSPVNIPSEPVSLTAAARLVSAIEGQRISRQGLTEYLTKHSVPTVQIGKRRKVQMADVLDARQSFTREVMRGAHLKSSAPKSQSNAQTKTSANPAKSPASTNAPINAPISAPITAIDIARDAKARKENAQAESAELALAKEKQDLVSAPAVEAAAASAMTSAKSYLIGPAIPQAADSILAALDLPESQKRDIETILSKTFRAAMNKLSQNLLDEFSRLNTSIGTGLPSRLDILTSRAAELRAMSNTDIITSLANPQTHIQA